MASFSSEDKFTLTWKVQNLSMCVVGNGELINSPHTFVEVLDKTMWRLQLCPKSYDQNYMLCYLHRIENEDSSGSISIGCLVTLVSVDNLLNVTKTRSCCVFNEGDREEFVMGKTDDIFAKRNVLLPGDIITIQCCMWRTDCNVKDPAIPANIEIASPLKSAGSEEKPISDQIADIKNSLIEHMYVGKAVTLDSTLSKKMYLSAQKNLEKLKKKLLPDACFIRTQISCERRSKIWEIKNFNEIQINETIFTSVLSTVENAPTFVLALHFSKDVDDIEDAHIDIQMNCDEENRYVVKCIMTILNPLYEDQGCIEDKHFFDYDKDIWSLPLIKKSKLCKDEYLKKGSLLLRCDLIITDQDSIYTLEETVSFPSFPNTPEEGVLNDWKMGLLRTLKDGDLCDVVLKSGDELFDAHKVILSAASSVLKDCLEEDLDEDTLDMHMTDCNCEPEILCKLLQYVYSGVLEEMTNEHLMKLYSAAKTLKIVALERQCSYTLRTSLGVSNVSEMLTIADSQHDEILKMAAMKFISVFPYEVFHSSSWEKFMENNAKLAGEAMHYVLTRKFVQ